MKHIIWLLCFAFLFNCAGKKIMIREAAKGNGYIIGTLTIASAKPRFDSFWLSIKSEERQKGVLGRRNSILIRRSSRHYKMGDKRVYLFIKELQAGHYEFFNFGFSNGYVSYDLKEEFSIPFTVEEGAVQYIGDFTFYPFFNDKGNALVISNQWERDLEAFKEKYPRLNWPNVKEMTLEKGEVNEIIIDFIEDVK